jgi:hypothetical protein
MSDHIVNTFLIELSRGTTSARAAEQHLQQACSMYVRHFAAYNSTFGRCSLVAQCN